MTEDVAYTMCLYGNTVLGDTLWSDQGSTLQSPYLVQSSFAIP